MTPRIGNDVVDLARPRTSALAGDERFLKRVLAAEEREALAAAADPGVELWSRWAAKEAAYKALTKLAGTTPPFVHRAFVARWSAPGGGAAPPAAHRADAPVREGRVRWNGVEAHVRVLAGPGVLHAVAVAPAEAKPLEAADDAHDARGAHASLALLDEPGAPWAEPFEELLGRFSEREAEAVRSRPSAAVRLGARAAVARLLEVAEERVELVCAPGPVTRRPPRVLLDGLPAPADVSLSHDGRWIAWAVCPERVAEACP
ncbi:MAG TPA: 4'-phosphopantetheinyl transferase superfamily protein [Longimicrobiales bacterium]|nr:4'-phosphopantetheinyl transferase superfamily protein [Longimicrobiales bacterium]